MKNFEENRKRLYQVYVDEIATPKKVYLEGSDGKRMLVDEFLNLFNFSVKTYKLYKFFGSHITMQDSEGLPATYHYFLKKYACDKDWLKKLNPNLCMTAAQDLEDISCLSIFGESTGENKVGCSIYNTADGEYFFCKNGRGGKVGGVIKYWYCKQGAVIVDEKELKASASTQTTKVKSNKIPVIIPDYLDTNNDGKGDKEGVEMFQDWLDTYHSDAQKGVGKGWATGYPDGKVDKGKGYGRFGPRTQSAWEKHKNEFMNRSSQFKFKSNKEIENLTKLQKPNDNLTLTTTTTQSRNNESYLSKVIKNKLVEVKENKKDLLVEETIVKNRISLVLESAKSHRNLELSFLEFLIETIKLKESGISDSVLIKEEESFLNLLGGLFGGTGVKKNLMGTLRGTLVEFSLKTLLNKLGLSPKSAIGRLFITTLGNVESFTDIPKLFTDCNYVSKLLSKSVVESIIGSLGDKYVASGIVPDAVRNSLTDLLYEQSFMEKIQSAISGSVCSILGGIKTKMEDKAKQMKLKALSR